MNASAGWYDDGSGRRRWWDGSAWTDRYEQQQPPPPPPPTPGTAYHPKMDTSELKPKQNRGLLFGCLGCIMIPIAVVGIMIVGALNGGGNYDSDNKYEAIAQCEARVKDLLKAPSTAQFSSDATGSGTWKVTGTVDAENSFGATLRSTYGCTVVINGDRATTTVDYFD